MAILPWLAAAAAFGALLYLWMIAPVGSGYKAKAVASALFVGARELESVLKEDVSVDAYALMRLFGTKVDRARGAVTCSLLGMRSRTAIHRPGLGATLAFGPLPAAPPPAKPARRAWPGGEPRAANPALQRVLRAAFEEPRTRRLRRTRAVLVVQDGRIVGERYAEGFGPLTPMPGWSMTKSAFSALIGVLVGRGAVKLEGQGLLPAWTDGRAAIRLEDLLRMRSGLTFQEDYDKPLRHVTQMLFNRADCAAFAAELPLEAAPGSRWKYSSGTSNILSLIARRACAPEEYLRLPREALFDPIGAETALIETDEAGTFVASSFMHASARDWARLGWLYAEDGRWDGARVLPEGWVGFTRRPTPQSPDGRYGAHWWLRIPEILGGPGDLPPDAFHAIGHEAQFVSVVPSRRLVVVRLGLSVYLDAWDHASFLKEVLQAL